MIIQVDIDRISINTARKISIYEIYYTYKLKVHVLMKRIAAEQILRKFVAFI
jgi:hypothetical protein